MIKLLLSGKQILIASLVFILLANTTNLTFPNAISEKTTKDWVNPAEATTDDKKSEIKKICKGFDGGSWDDDSSKCKFSKEAKKIEDDAEFDHVLSDRGLGEAYLDGIAAKEDKEKLTGYDEEGRQLNVINGDYDEEPKQIEDGQNQVTSDEDTMKKIKEIAENSEPWENGPITQTPNDDGEKAIKQLLAEEQEQEQGYRVESSPTQTPIDEGDDNNNNAEEATEQEEEADESQDEDIESVDDSSGGEEDDESEEEQDEPEEEEQDEPEEEKEESESEE